MSSTKTEKSNMVTLDRGPLVINVHTTQAPTEDEWSRYMARVRSVVNRHEKVRTLAITTGRGGPNARQREELADFGKAFDCRVACLTDSSLIRGMVTAVRWLGLSEIKAYAPPRLRSALAYLEVAPEDWQAVKPLVLEAQEALGVSLIEGLTSRKAQGL